MPFKSNIAKYGLSIPYTDTDTADPSYDRTYRQELSRLLDYEEYLIPRQLPAGAATRQLFDLNSDAINQLSAQELRTQYPEYFI